MFIDCVRIFQCIEYLRCGSLAHWVASLESQFSCLRRLIIHSVIPLLLYCTDPVSVDLCYLTVAVFWIHGRKKCLICTLLVFVFILIYYLSLSSDKCFNLPAHISFEFVCFLSWSLPARSGWGPYLINCLLSQNLFPICFCQMSNGGGVWNNTKMLKHGRVLEIGSIKVARLPKKKICSSITWATLARQPLPSSTWPTIHYLPFSF